MTTTLTPPPSSPIVPDKLRHFAPIFPNIPIDIMTEDLFTPDEPKAHLLKRVLSAGSTTSSNKESVTTPTSANLPLSPTSAGARTPRAKKTGLKPDVETLPADGKTNQLTSDMDGLKVQSPIQGAEMLPEGISQVMGEYQPPATSHDRSMSSSTDSSSTTDSHPIPPSQLGSSYGAEGFPITMGHDDYQATLPNSADLQLSAQAAAAVAAADEAIKQINGTATVFQGPPPLPTIENPYTLPRGYANFVKPQARAEQRSSEFSVHRQSSLSSNTTEASTSSEESDLCIPSIEWVNIPNAVSPSSNTNMFDSPYLPGAVLQQQQKVPGRMAPPVITGRGVNSPRRSAADRPALPPHQTSIPLGATAHTPGGLKQANSVLPPGVTPETPAEDDDDDATVGHGRDRSSSTSSQSAQSGLDLLWRAANHQDAPAPNTQSPYNHPYDSKGKRKAGAEAVAQWRNSGIPIGGEGAAGKTDGAKPSSAGPPKKRRRSEIAMEVIDPALRETEPERADDFAMDLENLSESVSADEEIGSEGDSEYQGGGGGGRPRGRPGVRQKSGAGAGGSAKKGKGGRVSTGTTNGTGPKAGGSGKRAKKDDDDEDLNGGGGGNGGSGSSRRASGGGPVAGVQCEYVNPLPPYNRCQDVFTRKYDLPRHMARHARREGELVAEGKLAEDKALLWKTIRDKPKVVCGSCGESFTRMDALKRHQSKQHHT